MINSEKFLKLLKKNDINFFTGVPDSLLKDLNACILEQVGDGAHIIAANEGGAIGLAAGYHLATRKSALVYLQNSGLGNAVNPLTSLTDPEVYGIPMLLLMGWRGRPGVRDEPQHVKQGRITLDLLDTLEIPYEILPGAWPEAEKAVFRACEYLRDKSAPFALVVLEETFEPWEGGAPYEAAPPGGAGLPGGAPELSREEAIEQIVRRLSAEDLIVSTTGMTSRELYEIRERLGQGHDRDFLTVGSMGHSSQIALGISLASPGRDVYCIDGDGAAILHMGSLAICGTRGPENFRHIVINNEAHDSVGGQPTAAGRIDIPAIAVGCGYKLAMSALSAGELEGKMSRLIREAGPSLLEVKVRRGARKDLGRPAGGPQENKKAFMEFLEEKK
jgi:phosphonopyruvate decarboxylase